ncbi:hypothetical protein AN958_09004 [Leucoagaricus sp. SymC.cos]|nr:hypothetical protein AN958_09004 [Leucoagaricus sp. SymC.cos]
MVPRYKGPKPEMKFTLFSNTPRIVMFHNVNFAGQAEPIASRKQLRLASIEPFPSELNRIFPSFFSSTSIFSMGRTRKKLKRNITGLRNQPKASPIPQILDEGKFPDSAEPHIEVTDPNVDEIPGPDEVLAAHPDNARVLCDEEEITECGDEAHSGEDPEGKTCRRSLRVRQFSLAIHCEDDPRDGDWVPPKLYKKHRQAKKGSEWLLIVRKKKAYFLLLMKAVLKPIIRALILHACLTDSALVSECFGLTKLALMMLAFIHIRKLEVTVDQ